MIKLVIFCLWFIVGALVGYFFGKFARVGRLEHDQRQAFDSFPPEDS